jgi:hypothetical protein
MEFDEFEPAAAAPTSIMDTRYHMRWNAMDTPLEASVTPSFEDRFLRNLLLSANEDYKKHCALSVQDGALRMHQAKHKSFHWLTATVALRIDLLKERNFCAFRFAGKTNTRTILASRVRFHKEDGSFVDHNLRSTVMDVDDLAFCEVAALDFRSILEGGDLSSPILLLFFQNISQDLVINEMSVI